MQARREGMLRPEFQDWYPSMKPGLWYPADELTHLVVQHLQSGSPQWRPDGRVPSDVHFAFRGGMPPRSSPRLSRATDRQGSSTEEQSTPQLEP